RDMVAETNLAHDGPAAMQSDAKADRRLQLLLERSVEFVNIGCNQRHCAERLTTGLGRLAAQAKDREHRVPQELVWQTARLNHRGADRTQEAADREQAVERQLRRRKLCEIPH